MSEIHFEDVLNFLVGQLAQIPDVGDGEARARQYRAFGSDVWIDLVGRQYWKLHGKDFDGALQDVKEPYFAPFYDAAWELCRRGVLRPAAAVPDGQENATHLGQRFPAAPFFGDGYSLTQWGRKWVKQAALERVIMPSSSSRITEVLHQFTRLFGRGYAQRAAEAVADWQTGNYLSACAMAGAAAESVLLAAAIEKTKDEAKVLSTYLSSGGRGRITKHLRGNTTNNVGDQFEHALGILTYWRDAAGHGVASSIGEIEAYEAISRLLRLERFHSNWKYPSWRK
jgi:hypothetical protein